MNSLDHSASGLVGSGDMKIPVLYSLEELFLLSQPLNKTMTVFNENDSSPLETDLADEPPRKRLKPSRPLKKRNNTVVKLEAKEFFHDQDNLETDSKSLNKLTEEVDEESMSREELRRELRNKQKLIGDLQDQFVVVQSENLYKDSEIKDLQEKVSSHLKTAAELLMTVNSLKSKVDTVRISESKQVKTLELKISQVEAENRSLKKNGPTGAGDHTDCEKKKKDLLIERLKIFQKFSEEEKVSARLRSKVSELELENVDLKTNQEKLNKSVELKVKELYEDKKNLEAAQKQIEAQKQEAAKEEDLRRKVEILESKVKKYKTLLRKTNQENFTDPEDQEAEETKAESPMIFSSFDQQLSSVRVGALIDESLDKDRETVDGERSDDKETSFRSFDARMFQISSGGNNNEKDDKKVDEDCEDLKSPKQDNDPVSETRDIVQETSEIYKMSLNVVTDDTNPGEGEGQDIQCEETEDPIKEVDSLDEPMFNELVIDLKEDMDSNDTEDTSNDNLVIDLKDDSNEVETAEEGIDSTEKTSKLDDCSLKAEGEKVVCDNRESEKDF